MKRQARFDQLTKLKMKKKRRVTASDLRFVFKTGTQRVHGRGMNKAWKEGSQGVFVLECPECGRRHNPEEEFPQIIRMRKPMIGTTECGMKKAGDGARPASNEQDKRESRSGGTGHSTPNIQHSTPI